MKQYETHPDVPVWLSSLNGNLLTKTELDVLNFIFHCKKFGCRTSNDRIGMFTHHSHATVQRALKTLYSMDLVAIDNYGKRTRRIKPVPWPDQAAWLKYKRKQANSQPDGVQDAPHIPPITKLTPTGLVMGGAMESTLRADEISTSEPTVPNLPLGSIGEACYSYHLKARLHRDKLLDMGWSKARAERFVRVKFPLAIFEEGT